jgi:4-hydroxybenzoate polyprenyltransferase
VSSLKPYLQLTRPANLVTAITDILAGMAIAQFTFSELFACITGRFHIGLYGGGVVMNDVFDAKLDSIERPERPIPSGKVPLASATMLGISLLFLGILAAAMFSLQSGMIADYCCITYCIVQPFCKASRVFWSVNNGNVPGREPDFRNECAT